MIFKFFENFQILEMLRSSIMVENTIQLLHLNEINMRFYGAQSITLLYSAPWNLILIKFKCSNCFITYGSILPLILKFYENYEIFETFWKFHHFEFFWNSMKFLKVLKFYENFEILWKFWILKKKWNFQIC